MQPTEQQRQPTEQQHNEETPMDWALGYARGGMPVFPCLPRPEGDKEAKAPYIQRGFHAATTDEQQIHIWWRCWPDALIGLVTGEPSGLVVLDLDTYRKPGMSDAEYETVIAQCEQVRGLLPATWTASSANGGTHLYFEYTRPIKCVKGHEWGHSGVDIRGDDGYIIAPGSRTDYGAYEWVEFGGRPAPLPLWVVNERNNFKKPPTPRVTTKAANRTVDADVWYRGTRWKNLCSYAGRLIRQGIRGEELLEALRDKNRFTCEPPLADKEVVRTWEYVNTNFRGRQTRQGVR
jgi:hypothetical protein